MGSPLVKVGVLSCKLCRKGLSRFVCLGAKGVLEGYLCVLNKFFRYGNVCTHLMCQYTCEVLLPLFLLLHPALFFFFSFYHDITITSSPTPRPAERRVQPRFAAFYPHSKFHDAISSRDLLALSLALLKL